MASDAASADTSGSSVVTAGRIARLACVAAALLHPVGSALARHFWVADLVAHFQEAALGASVLAAVVTARRRPWLAVALAVLSAFQVAPLVRYEGANPVPPDPGSTARLRVLYANVLHENRDYDDFLRLARSEKPDVIALVEFSSGWQDGLAPLRAQYPYRMEYPSAAAGMALWFREKPIALDPPEWLTQKGNCVLHAAFKFAGTLRHLWLVHPTSPLYRVGKPGNDEIAAIAARVRSTGGSRVVIGDMNSTDGSPHFSDFLATTGLRDSRYGFGRQASWPTGFRYYRIAIDHAFLSDDLAVASRGLGHAVGSDHFPLRLDIAPAAAKREAQSSHASTASR